MKNFLKLALIATSFTTISVAAATIPSIPTFTSLPSVDTDGTYAISWNSVGSGVRYVVKGEENGTIYNGYGLSFIRSSNPSGTYSYKIKACADKNSWTCSQYSETISIDAAIDPEIPGINDNGSTMSWTTTDTCGGSYPCVKSRLIKGIPGDTGTGRGGLTKVIYPNSFIFSPRIAPPESLANVSKAYNHRAEVVHQHLPLSQGNSITHTFKLTPNINIADAENSGFKWAIIFQDIVGSIKGAELVVQVEGGKLLLRQKYNEGSPHAEMEVFYGTEYSVTIQTLFNENTGNGSTLVSINGTPFNGKPAQSYTGRGLSNKHKFTLGMYHNYASFLGGLSNDIAIKLAEVSVSK